MNQDQVTGTAKDVVGKVQEVLGKLVGSKSQQAKGLEKQAEAKAEQNYGDAKSAMKSSLKNN